MSTNSGSDRGTQPEKSNPNSTASPTLDAALSILRPALKAEFEGGKSTVEYAWFDVKLKYSQIGDLSRYRSPAIECLKSEGILIEYEATDHRRMKPRFDPQSGRTIMCPSTKLCYRIQAVVRECLDDKPQLVKQSDGDEAVGSISHSEDFVSVNWYGKHYVFTPNQSLCVEQLWLAMTSKMPTMAGEAILAEANVNAEKLSKVFTVTRSGKQQKHAAWGTMIIEDGKSRYRLNVPENDTKMSR